MKKLRNVSGVCSLIAIVLFFLNLIIRGHSDSWCTFGSIITFVIWSVAVIFSFASMVSSKNMRRALGISSALFFIILSTFILSLVVEIDTNNLGLWLAIATTIAAYTRIHAEILYTIKKIKK